MFPNKKRIFNDKYIRIVVSITIILISFLYFISNYNVNPKKANLRINDNASDLIFKGPYKVRKVIDGDTIVLDNNQTVRLIGIDAPEIHHPEVPIQRFGLEAKLYLEKLIGGMECRIAQEQENEKDKYGRLLAYLYVKDTLINADMIKRGYAFAYTRFSYRYKNDFIQMEKEARRNQYGLWNFSLKDGRIANLVNRYDSLNIEGRQKLDEYLDELSKKPQIK